MGALLFSLYIVYDTDNLIKRYSYDEYVWASVGLYLDIINLFLRLLQVLRSLQGETVTFDIVECLIWLSLFGGDSWGETRHCVSASAEDG